MALSLAFHVPIVSCRNDVLQSILVLPLNVHAHSTECACLSNEEAPHSQLSLRLRTLFSQSTKSFLTMRTFLTAFLERFKRFAISPWERPFWNQAFITAFSSLFKYAPLPILPLDEPNKSWFVDRTFEVQKSLLNVNRFSILPSHLAKNMCAVLILFRVNNFVLIEEQYPVATEIVWWTLWLDTHDRTIVYLKETFFTIDAHALNLRDSIDYGPVFSSGSVVPNLVQFALY